MNQKLMDFGFSLVSKLQLNKILFYLKNSNNLNSNFIILTYHETSKKAFMDHIQYLENKYTIISFEDFYYQFFNKKYPSDPTFILTFDDGRDLFYHEIFPVCEELSIPIINYIPTDYVINKNPFWWDEVKEINNMGGKINQKFLAHITPEERRKIIDEAGGKINYVQKKGKIFSIDQILEMNKNKNISFGSHSVSHSNLALEAEENIRYELQESKKFLENLLHKKIIHFSYPYGYYNKQIIPILDELGYKTSVTSADKWVSKNDSLFEIPRIGAGPYGSSNYWLEARISGIIQFAGEILH